MIAALALALATLLAALGTGPALGATGEPSKPGAYCPFPEADETPQCFAPVEEEYADFIDAVEIGGIDATQLAIVEAKLQDGGRDGDAYLALSSLAYGYFRVAERAAAEEQPDPVLVERLQRWNKLLTSAYRNADAEPAFRTAVRTAALDLHARAPAVATECGPRGKGRSCRTTSLLLRTLRQFEDPAAQRGIRGALGHLLGRPIEREAVADPDELDQGAKGADPQ